MNLTPEWLVTIEPDLYQAGTADDGLPFIAEVYRIQLTSLKDGRRWRLEGARFPGAHAETCPETGETHFADVREAAKAAAQRLLERIQRRGRVNLDHWRATFPVYGSPAYQLEQQEAALHGPEFLDAWAEAPL